MLMFWRSKPRKISDLKSKLTLPLEEAKKRATILVIDDDQNSFPVTLLRSEGYNIQQWQRLENLRSLEEGQFDIIILDIRGIAPEEVSENDGLGVLEHIKRVNPAQIVIAYSGKKFDLNQERFWRMADDYFGKPIDMLAAKNRIDALLKAKFTIEHYWQSLSIFLRGQGVDETSIAKLENLVADSIADGREIGSHDIKGLLSAGKDIISTAWIIVQVIMRLSG